MPNYPEQDQETPEPLFRFPASMLEVELEICRGRSEKNIRKFESPVFVIGSALDCDLVLGDPQFPECYTYIYVQHSAVSLRKMPEGPDLSVNGVVLEQTLLHDGDWIRCGPFEFRISIGVKNSPTDNRKRRIDPEQQQAKGPTVRSQVKSRGHEKVENLLADIRSFVESGSLPNLSQQNRSTPVSESVDRLMYQNRHCA
ncbi:MAG: FHA domain-containing protein [Pirellulales bacterium]|jgi:hypothetical protein